MKKVKEAHAAFPPHPFGSNRKIKGSVKQDFKLQVFFMNQCSPGP